MLWRNSLRCRVQNSCNCRTCGCFLSAFRELCRLLQGIFRPKVNLSAAFFFDIAEKTSVLLIIAGHLMARIKISACRHGDHSTIAFAHRRTFAILSFAGVHCGKGVKFCFRIKRSELPYGQSHSALQENTSFVLFYAYYITICACCQRIARITCV